METRRDSNIAGGSDRGYMLLSKKQSYIYKTVLILLMRMFKRCDILGLGGGEMRHQRRYTAGKYVHICAKCNGEIWPNQEYGVCGKKKFHVRPDCERASATVLSGDFPPAFDYRALNGADLRASKRLVRTYFATARKYYSCCICLHDPEFRDKPESDIYPGELYMVEVWVDRHGWKTLRYHRTCPCPDPDKGYRSCRESERNSGDKKAAAVLAFAA